MLDEGKIVSDLLFGGMLMVFPHVFQPTLGTKSYSFLSSFTVSSKAYRCPRKRSNRVSRMGFHKLGYRENGRFIKENPLKMDDLGLPAF